MFTHLHDDHESQLGSHDVPILKCVGVKSRRRRRISVIFIPAKKFNTILFNSAQTMLCNLYFTELEYSRCTHSIFFIFCFSFFLFFRPGINNFFRPKSYFGLDFHKKRALRAEKVVFGQNWVMQPIKSRLFQKDLHH